MPVARILLIDDDTHFAESLQDRLRSLGHEVQWFELAEDGLRLLLSGVPADLILLDNRMPRMSGLEFLAALKKTEAAIPVVLMTNAHNDRTVIQAMNLGAFAYVIKPTDEEEILDELQGILKDALEITRRPRPVPLPRPAAGDEDDSLIIGRSKAILKILQLIGRHADLDESVLILGETGTGKDLVARAIHTNSRRKNKPFVVINCTALNESLLDDELFGHESGAYTGAEKLRKGRFEHAHGGTLFLDEVGDMPLPLQAKLLRVLENREIVRIGSNDPIRVDVRVLAATHCDLKGLVREGKFRQDLFYRLEGMTIHLPPLRERKEDIELLARKLLCRLFGDAHSAPAIHPAALILLRDHPWPGNIRQLQKVLCRAAGTCRGQQIMPEDLDFGELDVEGTAPAAQTSPEKAALAGLLTLIEWAWQTNQANLYPILQRLLEQELIRFALTQKGISQVQLARRLGIARNTLRARIEQYGFQPPPTES
jgi:DNA-binding NtrC family response regulator